MNCVNVNSKAISAVSAPQNSPVSKKKGVSSP